MSALAEKNDVKAPVTYQEWLDCFDRMKSNPSANAEVFEAVSNGDFVGSPNIKVALQKQIIETVNVILDKSAKRFIRELNESISFNELSQLELLFRRLKRDAERSLFFERLAFIPMDFRKELSVSVKAQMTELWDNTVGFLRAQSLEFSNTELEDALFLIRRIHLFTE